MKDFGEGIWAGKERGQKGQGWRPEGTRAGVGFPPAKDLESAVSSPVGSAKYIYINSSRRYTYMIYHSP